MSGFDRALKVSPENLKRIEMNVKIKKDSEKFVKGIFLLSCMEQLVRRD